MNGGARPGAGRKKKSTEEAQLTRRDKVLIVFTPDRWRECLEAMYLEIKRGNIKAFSAVAPYVMGAPPARLSLEHSGPNGGPIPVRHFDYAAALADATGGSDEDSAAPS